MAAILQNKRGATMHHYPRLDLDEWSSVDFVLGRYQAILANSTPSERMAWPQQPPASMASIRSDFKPAETEDLARAPELAQRDVLISAIWGCGTGPTYGLRGAGTPATASARRDGKFELSWGPMQALPVWS